jgi:hypothetical protein
MSLTNVELQYPPADGVRAATRIVIAHSRRCPVSVHSAGGIDRVARTMILGYGPGAARAAVERLNMMIDRGNGRGRDLWACVVHAIHDLQEGGSEEEGGPGPRNPGPSERPRRVRRIALAGRRQSAT